MMDPAVALRAYVLRAAKFRPLLVLDLYASPAGGRREAWAELGEEFPIARYLGGGAKPAAGPQNGGASLPLFLETLAARNFNVIDLDGAPDPWPVWAAVARKLRRPSVVFFSSNGKPPSPWTLEAMGIPRAWGAPAGSELAEFAGRFFLVPRIEGALILQAWRLAAGRAIHYGLLTRPAKGAR